MGESAKQPDWAKLQEGISTAAGQQTAANRPTQNTPWAQQNWTKDANGNWTQSTGFSGGMADAAAGLQAQAGLLGQPMDWGQFGQAQTGDQARDQAINAAYGQATSRLDPQWDKRMDAQRTQLLNQGLDPTSEAFRNQMQDMNFARNDAYGSAMNSAIGQGTAAGDSAFRNNMMARQSAIADALRQRSQPMQELQQLQGFLQMPGFSQDSATLQGALGAGQFAQQSFEQQERARQAANAQAADIAGGIGGAATGLLSLLF